MFALDLETLGVRSSSVILSIGMTYVPDNTPRTYQSMLDSSIFLKLDAKYQIEQLKREVDRETVTWWGKQADVVKEASLRPSKKDLKPEEALKALQQWLLPFNVKKEICWSRGAIDQLLIEDLAKQLDLGGLIPYNIHRDFRTAIDLLYGSTNGYCDVDPKKCIGFTPDMVVKHQPVHDSCLDLAMLLYGLPKP